MDVDDATQPWPPPGYDDSEDERTEDEGTEDASMKVDDKPKMLGKRGQREADEVEPGQFASLVLTTHGEIHLSGGKPTMFKLTYDDGLDELVFISAVSVASDSINYGVCQVQERSIKELLNLYATKTAGVWEWHSPTMEQIIGPFKRVRNLDQHGTLQPKRQKRTGPYADTLSKMESTVRHRAARPTAREGMLAKEYDPTRFVMQSEGGQAWQGIVLRPEYGSSVEFLDKTYLITRDEARGPPADNNALLFLPGGGPVMQMISNFKPREPDFYKGDADDPEPGSLLQKTPDNFPPVQLDRAAIGNGPCGNTIDGDAASKSDIAYPGLAAIVDEDEGEDTTVSTTLKCLVKNSVEAYRKRVGDPSARLGSLVVLDLTCMVFKDENGTFMDGDWGEDTADARDLRATRRAAIAEVKSLFEQQGAELVPTLTGLGDMLLPGHGISDPRAPAGVRIVRKARRPGPTGGRRTRRRRKVSKKRKTRTGRKTRRGVKVRRQRKTRGKQKSHGQRKTRRRR